MARAPLWCLTVTCLLGPGLLRADDRPLSHAPLRTVPAPSDRPLAKGPAYFADVRRGDDRNNGSKESPWRTLGHALRQLKAGDTLYLRGGTYHENVAVRLVGRAVAPITIRSHPGEQAILDGGLPEFQTEPAKVWLPVRDGAADEYRSARSYPNLRNAIGSFGDSMIGLHTYYHARDLRAQNELWDLEASNDAGDMDIKSVYCGPGLWYDRATGHIHARLSHTHLPGDRNYRGVTDPRKLPLVIAPFRSVPLHLDGARNIRLQDLVIRGGGYDTVVIDQSSDIEFDNVTVWCGTYGMRVTGTQRLKLYHCGLHGSVPPWTFRTDTSLRSYPGRPHRDITRLNTHALLVPEAGREFSVYALPLNDDWEIAYCDFTDGHDGLYLGSINLRFHHNRVTGMQDDGIYLSPMYQRLGQPGAEIYLYQNYIGSCLTALAFGGSEKVSPDRIYLYRNLVDLRTPIATGRPSTKQPKGGTSMGKVMGDHGSPPWPVMFIYQNTFVMGEAARSSDMGLLGGALPERPRRLFNNIFLHLERLPALQVLPPESGQMDANLYGKPGLDAKTAGAFFTRYRSSPTWEKSKKAYPAGFEAQSVAADPRFRKVETDPAAVNDYRLQAESPAVDAGADLPADWPDPLRKQDRGKPDLGALPLGAEGLEVGRAAQGI